MIQKQSSVPLLVQVRTPAEARADLAAHPARALQALEARALRRAVEVADLDGAVGEAVVRL